jgi:hypothetical protein
MTTCYFQLVVFALQALVREFHSLNSNFLSLFTDWVKQRNYFWFGNLFFCMPCQFKCKKTFICLKLTVLFAKKKTKSCTGNKAHERNSLQIDPRYITITISMCANFRPNFNFGSNWELLIYTFLLKFFTQFFCLAFLPMCIRRDR